jgi:predicted transcriptional regulator
MTEIERVLSAIDNNPGVTIEAIATATDLGFSAVRLIVEELQRVPVIAEDYDGCLTVTRIGDEVMRTRSRSAIPGIAQA